MLQVANLPQEVSTLAGSCDEPEVSSGVISLSEIENQAVVHALDSHD